jgi:hypothetical protein
VAGVRFKGEPTADAFPFNGPCQLGGVEEGGQSNALSDGLVVHRLLLSGALGAHHGCEGACARVFVCFVVMVVRIIPIPMVVRV